MVSTFDYSDFRGSFKGNEGKQSIPEGYFGRSGRDEYVYRNQIPEEYGISNNRIGVSFDSMRDQYFNPHKNRNFSALNLSPVERRNIIDQSYIRNNLPVPNRAYSSLGQQMNAMN